MNKKYVILLASLSLIAIRGDHALADERAFTYLPPQEVVYWSPPGGPAEKALIWEPPAGYDKAAQAWIPPQGFTAPSAVWKPPQGWEGVPEWQPEPDFKGKVIRE